MEFPFIAIWVDYNKLKENYKIFIRNTALGKKMTLFPLLISEIFDNDGRSFVSIVDDLNIVWFLWHQALAREEAGTPEVR